MTLFNVVSAPKRVIGFSRDFLLAGIKRGFSKRVRMDSELVRKGRPQQAIIQMILQNQTRKRGEKPILSRQLARQIERREANENRITAAERHKRLVHAHKAA